MRSDFYLNTHTNNQRTQLTIVTNIIEREFVATAILFFHFLRWAFYTPRHLETEGVKFQIRITHGVQSHTHNKVFCYYHV